MVSSRRLAREWVLKILYQIDVGKTDLTDARDTALDRLRLEFVQRGSRTAVGSTAESRVLDFVTLRIARLVPEMRTVFERALAAGAGRLTVEVPYLQELRLERSLRLRMAGLNLPRELAPHPDRTFFPRSAQEGDGLFQRLAPLTAHERAEYTAFIQGAREDLPAVVETELKRNATEFGRRIQATKLEEAAIRDRRAWALERRAEYLTGSTERWKQVGQIVEKQTSDWLRTAAFCYRLLQGTFDARDSLDAELSSFTADWRLERQVSVDRNIMRLAAFEMLHLPGIPTGASINEAVELAKKYSTAESGKFVNGVLGALAHRIGDKPPVADPEAHALGPDTVVDIPDVSVLEENDPEESSPDQDEPEEADTE